MPTSICTIRFQIRTILFAFRRGVGLPLPLHRILPFPHNHCKRTTHPRLAPPHLPPLSKVRCCRPIKFGRRPEGLPHHHPSPRTNPSKTALYHPLFVMPTSICTIRFQIRTILFAFRRGVGLPLPLHRILPFPHNHCKRTTIPRSTLSLQPKDRTSSQVRSYLF